MSDINNNLYIHLVITSFLTISFLYLIIKNSKYIRNLVNIKNYNQLQRTHTGEVLRFGGLVSYFAILVVLNASDIYIVKNFYLLLSLSFIPIFLVCFMEDVYQNTSINLRIGASLLSSIIFFVLYQVNFPTIEIPIIGELLQIKIFSLIFFSFCILVFINGNNMIDGLNGNMIISNLIQLILLYFLMDHVNDYEKKVIVICYFVILCSVLFFNFPYGKIFSGDLGSYLNAFVISCLTIIFFADYPYITPWLAILILFYPLMEFFFSFFRKLMNRKDPREADNLHLHIIIFNLLNKNFNFTPLQTNSLSGLVMVLLNSYIIFVFILTFILDIPIFFSILFNISCYLLIYLSAFILKEKFI